MWVEIFLKKIKKININNLSQIGTKYWALKPWFFFSFLTSLWRSSQMIRMLVNYKFALWAIHLYCKCQLNLVLFIHLYVKCMIRSRLHYGEEELRCCNCNFCTSGKPQQSYREFSSSQINLITKDYITLRFKNTFHEKRLRNWNLRVPAFPVGQAWGHIETQFSFEYFKWEFGFTWEL